MTSSKLSMTFRFGLSVLVMLTGCFLIAPVASAAVFLKGKNVHLTSLHRIDGDVYSTATDITFDGSIGGDLLAIGEPSQLPGKSPGR